MIGAKLFGVDCFLLFCSNNKGWFRLKYDRDTLSQKYTLKYNNFEPIRKTVS